MAIKNLIALLLITCVVHTSCKPISPLGSTASAGISKLIFLSEVDIPYNQLYKGTTIGGLSGIDYNPEKNEYYLISDDRSAINPARFYTAKIYFKGNALDSIGFIAVTSLLQQNNQPYPNSQIDPFNTPDPEALRINRQTKQMVWTSEGERVVKQGDTVLADPSIITVNSKAKFINNYTLPSQLHMTCKEEGPRKNGVLEGLTFTDDYKKLFISIEEPLYQDGPRAAVAPNEAWIRILKFDVDSRKPLAQYAYKLDPVAYPSTPADAFQVNGIPDILWVGNNKLLVIERSFSTGRLACTIKVFLADMAEASDISDIHSLKKNPPAKPINKKLILNMDDLGIYTDNIEGVTFGPVLPNGHQSLIFVSDNNFSEAEKTQFLLFEVVP